MAYPVRLSAFADLPAAPTQGATGQATARALVGALRAQRDGPLAALHQELHGPQPDAVTLARMLDDAQRATRQTLRLAELLALHGAHAAHPIALHEAVAEAFALRAADLRHCGMELAQRLHPAHVVAEPALLVALLHAAIDCTLVRGHRLSALLEVQPAGPVLVLTASSLVRVGADEAVPPGPTQAALPALAAACGVQPGVQRSAAGLQLRLHFPALADALEADASRPLDLERPAGGGADLDSWVAGLPGDADVVEAVLFSTDPAVVEPTEAACESLGVRLAVAPGAVAAAHRAAAPHLVLVDERLRDAAFENLRIEWQRARPELAVVAIGHAAPALAIAGSAGSAGGRDRLRIGRDQLWQRLPELLAGELPDRG